jgi:hypothetical protein
MKWFALLGLMLFLGVAVAPSINANRISSEPEFVGLVQSYLDLDYNTSTVPELIRPESEIVRIEINISYHVQGLFARLLSILLKWEAIPIELMVEDVPDWCQATVFPTIVYGFIKTEPLLNKVVLTVSVYPNAPAYEPFNLTVRATASPFTGPLGLFTLIDGAEDTVSIELTPGYYANFKFEHSTIIVIPPLELTETPINMTSYANADAFVQTQILDIPENWTITIPSDIIVEAGGTEQFLVSIIPPDEHNVVELFHVEFNISCYGHPEAGYAIYSLGYVARIL